MTDGVIILISIAAGVFSLILEERGFTTTSAMVTSFVVFGVIALCIGTIYGF
jgi:predicted membrane channel-forming protein YqfA (hemolysin III family)